MKNPLLEQFNTPFESIPFSKIKSEDYKPAFDEAVKMARKEIQDIIENKEKPSFENTIEAMEMAGEILNQTSHAFFNLLHAETNEILQETAQYISPILSEFSNDIRLNPVLFEKIKKVFEERNDIDLTTEQNRLLEKTYLSFARNGANLPDDKKEKLRSIDMKLSKLSLDFGNNVLAETNDYVLHLTDENDLKGLPDYAIEQAIKEAESRNKDGWIITLQAPSYVPFMTYADNRELRKELSIAYGKRSFQDNEFNNEEIVKEIVKLRLERANLLGYKTHADFVLEESMAKSPEIVNEFLADLLKKSKSFGVKEVEELKAFAKELDGIEDFQRWDHSYYAEKLKKEKFDFSEEELKPYFSLDNVIEGVFTISNKLFGLTFTEISNVDKYHEDVKVYEVLDDKNEHLALLYADFFPRAGKKAGAWMTSFRGQSKLHGKQKRPHISIVCNFTKPTDSKPSLLTFNEVTTLFHEFGHALHGMLANTVYQSLSGTNVYRDFVELPSQFMENFCFEREALELFAKHYETGEIIPQELIDKVRKASNYMEAYQTVRQLSFGILDMAYHSQTDLEVDDVSQFENKAFEPTDLYPITEGTNMSVSFSHIFNGGYSSGYYSYKWSEVLDADAFDYFKENGIFNAEIAKKFKTLLEKGGSVDPMKLYKEFRGKEPNSQALLKRAGLI